MKEKNKKDSSCESEIINLPYDRFAPLMRITFHPPNSTKWKKVIINKNDTIGYRNEIVSNPFT